MLTLSSGITKVVIEVLLSFETSWWKAIVGYLVDSVSTDL